MIYKRDNKLRWVSETVTSGRKKSIDSFVRGIVIALEKRGNARNVQSYQSDGSEIMTFERKPNLKFKRLVKR